MLRQHQELDALVEAVPHVALPPFDDALIAVAVALFYWGVCLGERVAVGTSAALVAVTTRLVMGLFAVARHAQCQATAGSATPPTVPASDARASPKPAPTWSCPNHTTQDPLPVPSPARCSRITRGATTCTLLVSSLHVFTTQSAATTHARHMLHDLSVVFDEIDAATCDRRVLERLLRVPGARRGVFPQLFLETNGSTVCLAMDQLETAHYFGGVPLAELVRLNVVSESALVLFRDVSSRMPLALTFEAQLRALGGVVVLRDALYELHASWHTR